MTGWRYRLAAAAAALAIAACTPALAQAPDSGMAVAGSPGPPPATSSTSPRQEAPPFIEVSGQSRVVVEPDLARLHFIVETEARNAADAASSNAELMTAVIAALRGTGVEGLGVETFGYNVQPVYARPDGGRATEISGYRAFNNVRATTGDTESVGTLIDAALGGGANRIAGLSFEAEDTADARREALRRAVASARGQAETIATAMGVPLGRALEVRGGAQPMSLPRGDMALAMRAEAVPTPVEAAGQTVTASVTIKYALGGGDR